MLYEYLFTSLVSVIAGASGLTFREQDPNLVLSLSLMAWVSMMAIIKLIKIDYYHDRNDYLWLIRSFTFVIFLIVGSLTCVNLYYNNDIQILMLGFFLVFVAILESFDPIVKYMVKRRRKKITKTEIVTINSNQSKKVKDELNKKSPVTSAKNSSTSSLKKKSNLKAKKSKGKK